MQRLTLLKQNEKRKELHKQYLYWLSYYSEIERCKNGTNKYTE